MNRQVINRISAIVPVLLSLAAFLMVVSALVFHWAPARPDGDEGAPAHVFQLLIAAQLPFILIYLVTADWRAGRRAAVWPLLQVGALVQAFAPVAYFNL
jgi:hypothetical protein